jgi:hypothetical protein
MHAGLFVDLSGSIATGGTAQTVVAQEIASRRYLFFQNISVGDLWLNFDAVAVLDQPSIRVPAGASIEWAHFIPQGAVSVLGATTGQKFVCKEAR